MVIIIGISGPSSSGKTYFAQKFAEVIKQHDLTITFITTDEFYLDRSNVRYEERVTVNYDEPDSIDHLEFYSALKSLVSGKEANIPVYDFSLHTRTEKSRNVKPSDIVIVEGIFAFSFPEINELYDLTIYVDLEIDLRLIRRIRRDTTERGRTLGSILDQHLTTVRPTQALHVEQDQNKADIILRGDHDHEKIIRIILDSILYKKLSPDEE
ncbi:MAG: uridine kinase [Candidatus Kariarchaeaceae archaeon]|jgi:uridine kinase